MRRWHAIETSGQALRLDALPSSFSPFKLNKRAICAPNAFLQEPTVMLVGGCAVCIQGQPLQRTRACSAPCRVGSSPRRPSAMRDGAMQESHKIQKESATKSHIFSSLSWVPSGCEFGAAGQAGRHPHGPHKGTAWDIGVPPHSLGITKDKPRCF